MGRGYQPSTTPTSFRLPAGTRRPRPPGRDPSTAHPLEGPAGPSTPTCRTLPDSGFSIPALPWQARPSGRPPSPSQVSNDLRPRAVLLISGHVASGRYPTGLPAYVRVPRHSFRWPRGPRFPRAEEASSRVPLATKFFAVWHRLRWDSLASPCGPFMVELFIRGAFLVSAPRRAAAFPPGPPVARSETPHASRVERTSPLFTMRPGPPGRDSRGSPRTPALSHHSLNSSPEVCPCRPPSSRNANTTHRVECWVLAGLHRSALTPNKPPSSRTSHSRGIRLQGSPPWLPAPFRRW